MLAIPSPLVGDFRYISTVNIPSIVEGDLGRLSGVRILSGVTVVQYGPGHLQSRNKNTQKCNPHFAVNWIGGRQRIASMVYFVEFKPGGMRVPLESATVD